MNGAIVTWIDPNSPAVRGHLQPGDIILSALGQNMPDSRAVMRTVTTAPDSAEIPLLVWRHGEMMNVRRLEMLELRSEVLARAESIARAESAGVGMTLADLTPADRGRNHLGDVPGVLIDAVTSGLMAYNTDLKPGDVILQVGDRAVRVRHAVFCAPRFARRPRANGDRRDCFVPMTNPSSARTNCCKTRKEHDIATLRLSGLLGCIVL
jgi:serine protease Do